MNTVLADQPASTRQEQTRMPAPYEVSSSPPSPAALRGHIDAFSVGRGFIHIQGWICQADNGAAVLPITVGFRGRSFPGYGLNFRSDLELAGIAEGLAALDIVLPVDECDLGTGHQIVVSDASGATCTLDCPAANAHAFVPSGHIDQVNSRFILGWVFDPGATDPRNATRLLLNEDEIAKIVPGVERYDLFFDCGDDHKTFGFEFSAEHLIFAIRQRLYIGNREATLALASSGVVLATVKIRLADGEIVAEPPPAVRFPPYRLPTSDRLDELLAALG